MESISIKKRRLFFCLIFTLCVALVGAIGAYFANAETASFSEISLSDTYSVGTEIDIPVGSASVGDKTFEVKPVIYFPSGVAYEQGKVVLSELGEYRVEYSVNVDGKFYSTSKTFSVYNYLLSHSNGNPLKYTHNEKYNANGVAFSVCPGEKIFYNKIIDLNEYTVNDSIILIDAIPETPGTPDARDLIFLLTDAYDESNYVTIRLRRGPEIEDQDNAYVTAAHCGNLMTGVVTEDWIAVDHPNYGAGFYNGLQGNWANTVHIDLRFDYANKKIYLYNSKAKTLIIVVDLVAHFGENAWKGFTTGECKLSVYADTYATTNILLPFNGIILGIDGQDLSKGNAEDGTVGAYKVDTVCAPIVDFGAYGDCLKIPKAMKGFPYKIFDCKVNSVYGHDKLTTRVYYGYGTSSCYEMPIKDGCFIPDNQGVYTIVYKVEDVFGNEKETKVDVCAENDTVKNLSVSVPDYEDYKTGYVGKTFGLVPASNVIVDGAFGFVEIKTFADCVATGESVEIEGSQFVPTVGGEWKIKYVATDYIGRIGAFTFKATVTVSDEVVFNEIKDLPSYFIVGAKNPVPSLTYIDYNEGLEEKTVSNVYFTKDGERVSGYEDGYFTPSTAGVYKVVYEAKSKKDVISVQSFNVTAVDVGFKNSETFSLAKYFYSDDVVAYNEYDKSVGFTLKENGSADFIRCIDGVNFVFTFNVGEVCSANQIDLTITDINDKGQSVVVSLINANNKVIFNVNGLHEYTLNNYKFGGGADFAISIKAGVLTVGSVSTTIYEYANGKPYQGFSSLLVNLNLSTHSDATGNTQILVKEVTGQRFYDAKADGDMVLPRIVIAESLKGKILVGETVKISRAKVVDVIDPYSVATLTVQDTKGKAVVDINGVVLKNVDMSKDYFVKIDTTGYYYIQYAYSDSTNAITKPRGSTVQMVSRDKPVITVEGGDRNVKVGDTVNVGTAKIDSLSQNVKVAIFHLDPVGNMKKIEEGVNSFVATQKGISYIRYFAIDEWGNMSTFEYQINVA